MTRYLTQTEQKIMDAALRASMRLVPDPRTEAYAAAVEQMLCWEQAGGDGWWKGWEALKEAHRRYRLEES